MAGKQATIDNLLFTIFGGARHPLAARLSAEMAASPAFLAFVEANAPKIRKKARGVGDGEGVGDLGAELVAARWLLRDRGVALVYEKYASEKMRGPDFTVTLKGHIAFNVEARRLRPPAQPAKAADAICAKLRQLPPSIGNVILLEADGEDAANLDLAATLKRLREQADTQRDDYFARRGFRDARDFLRHLPRLSAVFLFPMPTSDTSPHSSLWVNPAARHPLHPDALKLLRR